MKTLLISVLLFATPAYAGQIWSDLSCWSHIEERKDTFVLIADENGPVVKAVFPREKVTFINDDEIVIDGVHYWTLASKSFICD